MMNPHIPAMTPTGRRQPEIPFTPSPSQSPYPHAYHYHHQHQHAVQQHFHPQQNPQWYHSSMQAPMPRPYQQYPPIIASQYPMMHNAAPMLPRPNPPQHAPYSSSNRSQMLSPPLPGFRHSPLPSTVMRNRPSPPPAPPPVTRRMPYYPPLPWYSVSEADFPIKASRRRRRRPRPQPSSSPLELPPRLDSPTFEDTQVADSSSRIAIPTPCDKPLPPPEPSGSATPVASKAPSVAESSQPTKPSSTVPPSQQSRPLPSPGVKVGKRQTARIVPVVPIIPNIPSLSRSSKRQSVSIVSEKAKILESPNNADHLENALDETKRAVAEDEDVLSDSEQTSKASSPQFKAAPRSWADLLKNKTPATLPSVSVVSDIAGAIPNGVHISKADSISAVLDSFSVQDGEAENRLAFLKPRGLVNTGNMCYMNSILQVLVFCVPFYDFLDKVGKQATYSFKSETPLMDAMIMFIREFPVIDSAKSVEQLRMRLQDSELEDYGESFIPEFVYEVIRRLPRFSTMRRGHQQDAEEFLGFLLEEMHDECAKVMKPTAKNSFLESLIFDGIRSPGTDADLGSDNGWLEVGPRQKAAVTRSSGIMDTDSPITKIFGGKLRSELRVPGAKNSVMLEPYQPLQLDIGSPQVSNIRDALKGLTRSEILHGDFNSPRGPGVAATKQVFIETLPPVLILHLKRFQYDNTGGTQKIWKKVGYPLELEIPKEVFPQHRRGGLVAHGGLPKYRLIGVVYHHGKNAGGGHYTVDVRRQDGREWIRLDDTIIRRIRSEDVAEGGSEEDPKILAAALEQHKNNQSSMSNIFDQVRKDDAERVESETGWSQVNGSTPNSATASRKWSGVVNGTATPTPSSGKRTPVAHYSVKDNKVAYLLFYQKLGS